MQLEHWARTLVAQVTVASVVLVACSDSSGTDGPPAPKCELAFLGDKSQPPQIELIYSAADGTSAKVIDGAAVPMLLPLQGGRVIYAGARVTNIDPCNAMLTGSIRDQGNNQLRLDARSINFTPASDGWGETAAGALSSFANIPTCPNEWSTTSLFEGTYTLEVKVRDRDGRTVTGTANIKPSCGDPATDSECRCICKKGYVLGEACGAGGGGAGGGSSTSSSSSAQGGG